MKSLRYQLLATVFGFAVLASPAATLAADFSGVGTIAAPAATAALPAAVAATAAPAEKFIASMGDRALGLIAKGNATDPSIKSGLRSVLQQSFDLQTIGRFALGRYWRTATPEQQQQYLKAFENMIVDVYTTRFNEYSGQKFEVTGSTADTSGGADTLVNSVVTPAPGKGGAPVRVDWRVRDKGGSFKIVDVMVEGVSMAVTQRSDFAGVIQKAGGDFNALLAYLQSNQAAADTIKNDSK